MRSGGFRSGLVAMLASLAAGCGGGVPPDEALQRVRQEGGEFATLGPDTDPAVWQKAAEHYYRPAHRDYFEDMDAVGRSKQAARPSSDSIPNRSSAGTPG